jgi:8-hydroxy-5-deazaflavin:NADPH oxidoreductase
MDKPFIQHTIAILGGTGKEGKGLAYRWAKAGYHILIGSRSPEKAQKAAQDLISMLGGSADIGGTTNLLASQRATIAVLTVPYPAQHETLESCKDALKGKILINVVVPLVQSKETKVQMPPEGSAAQAAHQLLGPDVQVTSAFQNISYDHLLNDGPIECEVLVTGTSREARLETLKLVTMAGLVGWDAGPLANSAVVEGLTSILIGINKLYKNTNVGIRITGIQHPAKEI